MIKGLAHQTKAVKKYFIEKYFVFTIIEYMACLCNHHETSNQLNVI